MAVYHLRAKIISRKNGQNAIAAAAYRSGTALRDQRDGSVKDFTARENDVAFSGIFTPAGAPEWMRDREALWNRVEGIERRKDSQLARELEISLPHEMTDQQREWLLKDFVREQFTRRGFVVDAAIHAPGRNSDARHHHAHLMVTMRQVDGVDFAATKDRSMNERDQLGAWREEWANLANRHLARHGIDARIDHRSLEDQGAEREPQKYEGPAVTAMARRGEITDRRAENMEIVAGNALPERIEAEPAHRPLTMRERMEQYWAGLPDRMRAADEEERRREAAAPSPAPAAGGAEMEWTDRAGMVAQQRDAAKWSRKAAKRAEARRPRPEAQPVEQREHPERGQPESQQAAETPLMPARDPERENGRDPRVEIRDHANEVTDRKAEVTDARAMRGDLETERERFLARRSAERTSRSRDDDGGREL